MKPIISTSTRLDDLRARVEAAQRRYDTTRTHRALAALYAAKHALLGEELASG